MRRPHRLALLVGTLVLSACGDRVQTIGVSTSKPLGGNSWDLSSSDPYVAVGWKPGDRTSWDDQLSHRVQMQNDYASR